MYEQVKVFRGEAWKSDKEEDSPLEIEVNNWLEKMADKIEISDRKIAGTGITSGMIVYFYRPLPKQP